MTKLLVRALALIAFTLPAQGAPLSGTKSIGPTGDYTSIGAAIADIQAQTLGGALVLELQAAYVSTVETFPLVFSNLGTTVTNTLTLRPQTGATGLSISSEDTTAATVDLNGAQFVVIDGRPGGTGTVKQLTIANTSTSGVALRFINEASNNTIQYTTLQGVNTSTTSGVVVFSTTTGANGNDNNTIDHCDIRDGASTPTNGLYALGTTGTTAQNNSSNTVSNCNIFNFYASDSAGVRLDDGSTDWTLASNSFYQTASRVLTGSFIRPIYVNSVSGNNFTITSNFIGGSAPSLGGAAWTTAFPSGSIRFVGIHLNVGTDTPSSVQGNTVSNILWTSNGFGNSTTLPGSWNGIHVQAGTVNIGTVTGNTIGSGTGTGSVSCVSYGNGFSYGICSSSRGDVTIANNTIGSITVNGMNTTYSSSFTGILVAFGVNTISNNQIGSPNTANSLNAPTSSTSTGGQQIAGIVSTFSTSVNISSNTVANLNNNYAGGSSAGQIRGIVTMNGANVISGNTVRNLSTTSQNQNTSSSQSVYGIVVGTGATGQAVSQNTVHSLANTAATAAVSVTGIYFNGASSGTRIVSRNLVHSLSVSSTSTSSVLNGMQFVNGSFTAQNNMVRVGLNPDGTGTAGASITRGIYDNGTTEGRNYYHNSVYLGGTQTSGTNSSYAFNSTGSSNRRTFLNNIFFNARSNTGATSKHYAVSYGGASPNPAGLMAGGNILLATGTGGMLGSYSFADRPTLAAWQEATAHDASSAVVNPMFLAPTGTAATGDLHLQFFNPVERGGIPIAEVTDDFDGQTRSTLSPSDIGADAGNFFLIGNDIFAPGISYTPLSSGTTANRVLTDWADITDGTGVSGGTNAPRLYFKKSTDADDFNIANDSSGNGWKYVTASGDGPYSFTLDYSLINGGSVSNGDTIQYFVVAQDAANNLSSSPAAATASANPPVPNVYSHGAVNSFIIFPGSGTVTVGSGGDYASLSGTGGLFAAINDGVLTGDLVVTITSDVVETGSVTLNQWSESGPGNYTLTIQPDSATMRTISGSSAAGLITLNGADRVTIDGRSGGGGRYLTFRNTNTAGYPSSSTILFINDASSNTVRNCVAEGAIRSTLGVIGFSTGTVTGNDDNLITDCQVRDLSTTEGVPYILIGSFGSSDAVANSNNTISNNELFNFRQDGISISTAGNDSWTLTGNNIYEVTPAAFGIIGIYMNGGGTNVITDNFIHDLLTTGTSSNGIYARGPSTTTIARNLITAFDVSVATTFYGIRMFGSADTTNNVVNNQIILMPAASTSSTMYGIYTSNSNAYCNSIVLGGTESGAASSWAHYSSNSALTVTRNNLFLNLRTGGTASHFAAGIEGTTGSYIASNNVYAGTGATVAANFMDFSDTTGTAVPVDFATWQSSTGDTNSQAGIAGSGSFTTAMFVDAANGDLHLIPGGNALVNALGTPIPEVTDDYDGDPRPASAPSIGADQIPFVDIAVAASDPLIDGAGSVDFGNVLVGSSSTAQTFTITNSGSLDLTSLAITGGSSEFAVSALSGTSVPVGGISVTFIVTFNPTASGGRNAAIHIASNLTGTKNPFDIMLTGTGLTDAENWRQTFFGVTTNSGNAADTFDFDKDGLPNLIEWACNLNPTTASTLPASAVRNGASVEFTYTRSVTALNAGTGFVVEWSDTLGNDWQSTGVSEAILADDGTVQQVKATLPAGSTGRRFVHLKVTGPP